MSGSGEDCVVQYPYGVEAMLRDRIIEYPNELSQGSAGVGVSSSGGA